MFKNKIEIGTLILAILLVSMALIPAANAQEEKDYSITVEEAFKHANAHMISFIAADAPGFENWTDASVDAKPLELYDINGQKLYYQFSVYKKNKTIGTINVCANKTLGSSIQNIRFDPKPYKTAEAMKKSKKIANDKYPTGEIRSTVMVVYSYPKVGAMTIIKDKGTGDEYRIFVDAYTLDEIQDKPINKTEDGDLGVWSMYETMLENGVEENLKEWQKSDNFTKSIEQAATSAFNVSDSSTSGKLYERIAALSQYGLENCTNPESPIYDPSVVNAYGNVPIIHNASQLNEFADKLRNVRESSWDEIDFYPNGSIVRYGSDTSRGYFWIELYDNRNEKYSENDTREIYEIVEKYSIKNGIENIPVVFTLTNETEIIGFMEFPIYRYDVDNNSGEEIENLNDTENSSLPEENNKQTPAHGVLISIILVVSACVAIRKQ